MTAQTITAVKIGNALTTRTDDVSKPGCRTRKQHDAVIALHKEIPSLWWIGNPFVGSRPGQKFSCGFAHSFYDRDGAMRTVWVEKDGTIFCSTGVFTNNRRSPMHDITKEKYGLFQGA